MVTKVCVVYDNISFDPAFEADWGFGCVVEHDNQRILFDTGAKPDVLLKNLSAASIEPSSITKVFISHKHWDHKGGVSAVTNKNPDLEIYIPIDFPKALEKELQGQCKQVIRVKSSGPIGKDGRLFAVRSRSFFVKEQSLAIKTEKGAVVLTGCSHSGIDTIARKSKDVTGVDIYVVLGGFHLFKRSSSSIEKVIQRLKKVGTRHVAPCHCTGQKGFDGFKEAFSDRYLEGGAGAKFEF